MRKKAARSHRREPDTGALIFVELGAAWPPLDISPERPRRAIAQLENETPSAFMARASQLVGESLGRGAPLGFVAISCNERVDPAAEAARKGLAELSLGMMAKRRAGQLYLAAPPRSGGRLRHALSAMASELAEQWQSAGLEVKVLLDDERSEAPSMPYTWTARVA